MKITKQEEGQIFRKLEEKEPERQHNTERSLWKNETTWCAVKFGKLRKSTGKIVSETELLEEII
jgi:hypothetical protein